MLILTEAQHSSVMAMIISLQKTLDQQLIPDKREEQFIKHSLNYLVSTSQQQAHIDSWTITSFEVEFGEPIGSGGLSVHTFHIIANLTSREIIAVKFIEEFGTRPRLLSKF